MAFQVGELFVQLNLDSTKFSTQFDKIEAQLKAFAKEPHIVKVSAQLTGASVLSQVKTDLQSAGNATQQLGSKFSTLGSTMRTALSVSIGNLLTVPLQRLAGILPGIITTTMDFEHGLSAVAAVAGGLSQNQLEQVRQKALEIGRDTSLSATQATQAFEALVANGIKVDESFNGIAESTVALSEATGSDLTTAANVATDVIQNFVGAGDDMQKVVNGITGVTVAGKFQIEDYALALANGGVQTAGLGVSLEDFNAVIAATSSSFKSGMTAGTSFRMFVQSLTPSTKVATDAMKELGLITASGANQFYDSQGALKSQVEIFAILEKSFGTLTQEQKAMYSSAIFGVEGANMLTAALRVGSEGLTRYADDIAKINSADIAKERLNNLAGQITILKGSFESLAINIGSSVTPALMSIVQAAIPVINTASDIVEALNGSEEAFNRLSPAAQTVVIAFQEISTGISSTITEIQSIVSNLISSIESYFGGIIDAAYGWGNNVGGQFASGLAASVGSIVDSVAGIGDSLSYWLEPGSPPRIAPDLDKWGSEVGKVYYDAIGSADYSGLMDIGMGIQKSFMTPFEAADYSAITDFTNQVKSIFDNLKDNDKVSDKDAISSVIGTRESFTRAIEELKLTGSVSKQTFDEIISSAGIAGMQVGQLTVGYLQWRAATEQVTRAQIDLTKAQEKLNAVQAEFDAQTRDLRDSLEKIRKEQELADIKDQIKDQKKLATAVGGDGSIQAKAKRELIRLTIEQQIAEKAVEFSDRIIEAQKEVDIAKDKVDLAKSQEQAQKQQYELLQQQIAAQKEQNQLIKEQNELMSDKKSGGGGGGSKAPEIDKDKAAQEAYAYSIATTAEKLEILKGKLAGVQEGSAEYYKILGQINQVSSQQQSEDQKLVKELEAKEKAQRDYEYSIADSAGKLAILKKELSGVEKGSADYYKILGEINQLENQKPKGGGGGIGGIKKPDTETGTDQGGMSPAQRAQRDVHADDTEQNTAEIDATTAAINKAKAAFATFMQPLQPVIDAIKNNLIPILAGLLTPTLIGVASILVGVLAGAFAAILSPIGLISVAVFALALAWQNNFANIQGYTEQALTAIGSIISSGLAIAQQFWAEHGATITAVATQIFAKIESVFLSIFAIITTVLSGVASFIQQNQGAIANIIFAVWNQIQNFINNAMSVIQSVVNLVLAVIQGDWNAAWTQIQLLASSIITLIGNAIRDGLAIILSLFGVNTAEFLKIWDGFGILISAATDTLFTNIKTIVDAQLALIQTAFTVVVTAISAVWETLKNLLPESAQAAIKSAITKVEELVEAAKTGAKSVGTGFVDGIVEGIKSKVKDVIAAAKSIVNAAIGAANKAQDSHSPSKIMMQTGIDYGDGYIIGIQDTLSKAVGTVATAVNDFTGVSLPQSMQPATTSATTNMNYYYTIDARGSDISEDRFREIIKQETNTQARRGNIRGR